MNSLKACGLISVSVCDGIVIFSKRGGRRITLYGSSKKPSQVRPCAFPACPFRSLFSVEDSSAPTVLWARWLCPCGAWWNHLSLWLDAPDTHLVPRILTEGKTLWRDTWDIWVSDPENFLSFYVCWVDVYVLFNSGFTGHLKFWEDQAEKEIHRRCIYIYPILHISVSGTRMVVGFIVKKIIMMKEN